MADNLTKVITVKFDIETGTSSIRGLDGKLIATQLNADKLQSKLGEIGGVTKKSTDVATKGVDKLNKSLKQGIDKTGLAGAAVVELGRTISDSNYGFTAMANNISQLGTLFTTLTVTTGGFTAGLRAMWAALMGPLGIIVAFQVVIAVFERFALSARSANSEVDKLNESLAQTAVELVKIESLKDSFDDLIDKGFNPAVESADDFITRLKTIVGYKDNVKEFANSYKDSFKKQREAQEKYNKALSRMATIREVLNLTNEPTISQAKEFTSATSSLETATNELNKANGDLEASTNTLRKAYGSLSKELRDLKAPAEGTIEYYEKLIKEQEKVQDTQAKTNATYKESQVIIDGYIAKIKEIRGEVAKIKPAKIFPELKELQLKQRSIQSQLDRYNRELELLEAETEEEKFNIKLKYELKALKMKEALEIQAKAGQIRRFIATQKELLKAKGITESRKEAIQENIDNANIEAKGMADAVREKYKPLFALFNDLSKARRQALFGMGKEGGVQGDNSGEEGGNPQQGEIAGLEDYMNTYKDLSNSFNSFLQGEADREISIARNKTNQKNDLLREQLRAEGISANERQRIQQQISKNDAAQVAIENKINKKRFEQNKAFSIATAMIDTYAGATRAFKDYPSPASWIIASATIAKGLLNVATISRQRFVPTASSANIGRGGAGGGGGNSREFDFNLVGSSGQNQVAQSLQGQIDKPVKAYVVSKEITSQQEFDLNTRKSATIGG